MESRAAKQNQNILLFPLKQFKPTQNQPPLLGGGSGWFEDEEEDADAAGSAGAESGWDQPQHLRIVSGRSAMELLAATLRNPSVFGKKVAIGFSTAPHPGCQYSKQKEHWTGAACFESRCLKHRAQRRPTCAGLRLLAVVVEGFQALSKTGSWAERGHHGNLCPLVHYRDSSDVIQLIADQEGKGKKGYGRTWYLMSIRFGIALSADLEEMC